CRTPSPSLRVRPCAPCHSFLCLFFFAFVANLSRLRSFPTRRSSDLVTCSGLPSSAATRGSASSKTRPPFSRSMRPMNSSRQGLRSEEHTSELQSRVDLVCRLLLEKKQRRAHPPRTQASSARPEDTPR